MYFQTYTVSNLKESLNSVNLIDNLDDEILQACQRLKEFKRDLKENFPKPLFKLGR